MVRELFRDQAATEFIIATIPTVLGINESARLLQALRKERIPCKRIIVNQVRRRAAHRRRPLCADSCPGARVSTRQSAPRSGLERHRGWPCPPPATSGAAARRAGGRRRKPDPGAGAAQVISESLGAAFLRLRLRDQAKALAMLQAAPELAGLQQLRAPLVDLEVRGLPALRYFGGLAWQPVADRMAAGARTRPRRPCCLSVPGGRPGHGRPPPCTHWRMVGVNAACLLSHTRIKMQQTADLHVSERCGARGCVRGR